MIKAAPIIVILLLLAAVIVMRSELTTVKKSLAAEAEKSTRLQAQITEAEEIRKQQDNDRTEYINRLRASKDEIEDLRNDLADKRKRVSIGVTCPGVPQAADTSGIERVTATLDAHAERTYLRLREQINATEAWAQLCYKTVNGDLTNEHQ